MKLFGTIALALGMVSAAYAQEFSEFQQEENLM